MYIDSHVHCRDGKQAYKETIKHALEVAEKAGVDAIFDMPNTNPPIITRGQVIERLRIADLCNSKVFYGLYVGLTSDPQQIIEAIKTHDEFFPKDDQTNSGVVGLKLFAGKSVGDLAVVDTSLQMKVYKTLSEADYKGVLVVHCEKESFLRPELWNFEDPISHCNSRPALAELSSIQDQVVFALDSGFKGKLHIAHVSCSDSVEYISLIKRNHPELKISCGATPHHLFFNEEFMKSNKGLLLKVNPPLRTKENQKNLLNCLRKGMINWIETDHAPHQKQEKLNPPYMSGIPWLNQWPNFIELLRNNDLQEEQIKDLTFNNVKKVFGINIKKTENTGTYFQEYDSEFNKMEKIQKIKIGSKEVMPFVIPSGIISTNLNCLERMTKIPEIGIFTTKSIGLEPRFGNREPVLSQYSPGCFINAVGLKNPGVEEFAKQLSKINIPNDKFLLCSIFGKNLEEFVFVAKKLEEYVDGFELNLSCPHAKGYGMQLGQDPELVGEITKAVVSITKKPVFAKLTPNANNIGEIAKSAVDHGAYGIVAINTVGPGYYSVDGKPVLTNEYGGLSGIGITPIGIKCIKNIKEAVGDDVLIIGMGGISNAEDIEAYSNAGASAFGIGSSLTGMTEKNIMDYFSVLVDDLNNKTNKASEFLKKVDMKHREVKIIEVLNPDCNFKIFKTNISIDANPGQFVFAWIPGIGEKPFSVMDNDPLTLGVLERGYFTKEFNSLKKGDSFYFRGPYGKGVEVEEGSDVVLVGGGCGIAGLYLLAKILSKKARVISLLGAKSKIYVPYLEEFKKCGKVGVATEDGSLGVKGMITDLFKDLELKKGSYFFNCGPKVMIDAIFPFEKEVSSLENIYSSIDYMTGCGVGICGSCSDEKGRRTCIEGPFMNP